MLVFQPAHLPDIAKIPDSMSTVLMHVVCFRNTGALAKNRRSRLGTGNPS